RRGPALSRAVRARALYRPSPSAGLRLHHAGRDPVPARGPHWRVRQSSPPLRPRAGCGAAGMTAPLLSVHGLTKCFGCLTGVDRLARALAGAEPLGPTGPNAAGKTPPFNMIAGAYTPTEGETRFAGEPIQGLPPHAVARRGIMRTFQHNMPFASMSVADN